MSTDSSVVLKMEWASSQVILSAAMAFLGAYSAVSLAELYRVSFRHKLKAMTTPGILFLAGLSLAAAAIWSMHFVGMGAMKLVLPNGARVNQSINIVYTLISLLSAVIFAYGGLLISTNDKMFALDKEEVIKLVLSEVKSFSELKNRYVLFKSVLLRGLGPLVVGGIAAGAGVCCMHFLGMSAVTGDFKLEWDVGMIVLCCVLAVVASTAAFWIIFRLLALFPSSERLRITSAVVMMVAVLAVHYTGMMGVTYRYEPSKEIHSWGGSMSMEDASQMCVILGVIFFVVVSMIVQGELRGCYYNLASYEKMLDELSTDERFCAEPFVSKFMTCRNKHNVPVSVKHKIKKSFKEAEKMVVDPSWSQSAVHISPEKMYQQQEMREQGNSSQTPPLQSLPAMSSTETATRLNVRLPEVYEDTMSVV